MQQRATLWIYGTFCTSSTTRIKATLGFIPIHLYFRKLYRRFLLRKSLLPPNHIISNILSSNGLYDHIPHNISINNLTSKQRLYLNSPFIDMDNRHNELLLFFSFFDEELNLENWPIDSFSDCFSFHLCLSNTKSYIKNLNNIIFKASSNSFSSIIVSNASIKNYVVMLISYIYLHNKPIIKIIYKVVNVITTKAELFTIRCGINQVIGITNVNYIVIITDSLHTAKRIFNFLPYLYQT